jgi:hypothetical protein
MVTRSVTGCDKFQSFSSRGVCRRGRWIAKRAAAGSVCHGNVQIFYIAIIILKYYRIGVHEPIGIDGHYSE